MFVRDDIYETGKELGLEMDGKKYRDIHNQIVELMPELHTREELKELAQELTDKILSEYGWYAYRVFAYFPLIRTKGYNGFEQVYMYRKIHDAMKCSAKAFCTMKQINHKLDLAILEHEFCDIYRQKYGFLSQYEGGELCQLMEMIWKHIFDVNFIKCIKMDLEDALIKAGDNYFHKQDLTDEQVMKQLYRVVGEVYGLHEFRDGIFTRYDGYGNVVYCEL